MVHGTSIKEGLITGGAIPKIRKWVTFTLVTISVFAPTPAKAEAPCAAPWENWSEVGSELIQPLPLALVAGSAIPPIVFSPTGWDHDLRVYSQTTLGGSYNPEPISIPSPYVAIGATFAAWSTLRITKICGGQRATSAMIQGVGMTLVFVGFHKWATGRSWPTGGQDAYAKDRLDHPEYAQTWKPFRNGAVAAFPSGHTASMFALAAALRTSSPELGLWRYIGYPIATGIGFLMWYGDHHWASDILSGAMIGEALGASAGRAWNGEQAAQFTWSLVPGPGGAALSLQGTF